MKIIFLLLITFFLSFSYVFPEDMKVQKNLKLKSKTTYDPKRKKIGEWKFTFFEDGSMEKEEYYAFDEKEPSIVKQKNKLGKEILHINKELGIENRIEYDDKGRRKKEWFKKDDIILEKDYSYLDEKRIMRVVEKLAGKPISVTQVHFTEFDKKKEVIVFEPKSWAKKERSIFMYNQKQQLKGRIDFKYKDNKEYVELKDFYLYYDNGNLWKEDTLYFKDDKIVGKKIFRYIYFPNSSELKVKTQCCKYGKKYPVYEKKITRDKENRILSVSIVDKENEYIKESIYRYKKNGSYFLVDRVFNLDKEAKKIKIGMYRNGQIYQERIYKTDKKLKKIIRYKYYPKSNSGS
ncbi:MAG: hypothetical protein H7A25_15440 [Leptospiraceae bacterium]|nr:hypothetical protein [Leptospiraceae bacterium]